jgi:hypothetical protein
VLQNAPTGDFESELNCFTSIVRERFLLDDFSMAIGAVGDLSATAASPHQQLMFPDYQPT